MHRKALVFSGQGAQFVGMGKDLADRYDVCRELFCRADEVLGYGISRICFEGPDSELTKSNHCQPAIFIVSAACYAALRAETGDIAFEGLAGLSLGEWTALYAAGALTFDDALRVLEARGRFMQEACDEREGGMVSVIGLPMDKIQEICDSCGTEIANLNSDAQTVLSGEKSAVTEAARLAQEKGAKRAIVLNVAGAFHSSLMASAARRLETILDGIEILPPRVPVVANVTGEPHKDVDSIRRNMVRQVTESVRWVSCVEWLKSKGVNAYVECGPGKVLTGLIKRIDAAASLHNIQDSTTLSKTVQALGADDSEAG
ncbi:MAG: ACP S-malonyltransferase [Lentisphaerae bacterium]|nr:ACP S-malonyltransferase [Lentisphaerota bacterium]